MIAFVSDVDENSVCVGVGRVGAPDQQIHAATLQNMTSVDLGPPLHSLVIAGNMHPIEMDMLKMFSKDSSLFSDSADSS